MKFSEDLPQWNEGRSLPPPGQDRCGKCGGRAVAVRQDGDDVVIGHRDCLHAVAWPKNRENNAWEAFRGRRTDDDLDARSRKRCREVVAEITRTENA